MAVQDEAIRDLLLLGEREGTLSHALVENARTEQAVTTSPALPYIAQALSLAVVAVVLLTAAALVKSPVLSAVAILPLTAAVFTATFAQYRHVFSA